MKNRVGRWIIEAIEDVDGHLTVALYHTDGSKVIQLDADIETNDKEWSDRFTTEIIEKDYIETILAENAKILP